MNTRKSILAAALAFGCLFTVSSFAQDKMKMVEKGKDNAKSKSYMFHGKVEGITEKGLTINGEKVEGWMDAMTMSYPVDKPDVLKKVKVGDMIMATVYKGDMTLHNVEVMPMDKSGKQKSTK
ncbi:MAG: copper-binding protein [Acidobacteriota bacterium]